MRKTSESEGANPAILTPPADFAAWLAQIAPKCECKPLAGDASARRYFRVRDGDRSCVAMLSPPPEDLPRFLAVREFLESRRVRVPRLYASDADAGFALIEDFGDDTYLSHHAAGRDCEALYDSALRALARMQGLKPPAGLLPEYGSRMLADEMTLYDEWYCSRHLGAPLENGARSAFESAAAWLTEQCLAMPQTLVHRDYHSRNLMDAADGPGILDFQDAVVGPAAYDIASLLRDAYIAWPAKTQERWLARYCDLSSFPGGISDLRRAFNIASAQRGLKVLGIFARLWRRDGKSSYLADMPRARAHLLDACAAVPELQDLSEVVKARPPPCMR